MLSEELWWSRIIVNKYEKAEFTPFTPDIHHCGQLTAAIFNHIYCGIMPRVLHVLDPQSTV